MPRSPPSQGHLAVSSQPSSSVKKTELTGSSSPYILAAVVGVRDHEITDGVNPKDPILVMVTCCEYGMEIQVPSHAIKLLAPRAGGTLRFVIGEKTVSVPIAQLEDYHGEMRNMWLPLRHRKKNGLEEGELHVVMQYFNNHDVAMHSPQTTARLEQAFRKKAHELEKSLNNPNEEDRSAKRLTGSSPKAPASGDSASRSNLKNQNDSVSGTMKAGDKIAGDKVEELAWKRIEPYRKIIEALESKVAQLEGAQVDDSQWQTQLQAARNRNKEIVSLFEVTNSKSLTQLGELRKDYDTLLTENQNLLRQLQDATSTIYEGREQQESLVKALGIQKANILLLEGKVKLHDSLGKHIETYKYCENQQTSARIDLQKEYSQAVQQFADQLFKLKKDLTKIQDEKVQLQVKFDETNMHLESAKFQLEALQTSTHTDSDNQFKKVQLEEWSNAVSMRHDLIAANTRRDQLERELARVEEQSQIWIAQEKRNVNSLQDELAATQRRMTELLGDLTRRQEETSAALLERNQAQTEAMKLGTEMGEAKQNTAEISDLQRMNAKLQQHVTVLTQSFDELRKTYARETEIAQAEVVPSLKRELGNLRKENKKVQDSLQQTRYQLESADTERRRALADIESYKSRLELDQAKLATSELFEAQLHEKEKLCTKQKVLFNDLSMRFEETAKEAEATKQNLNGELQKRETLIRRLTEVILRKTFDLNGKYLPDKMDSTDLLLGTMLNADPKRSIPVVRLGTGQYLVGTTVWGIQPDEAGELLCSTGANKISFDKFAEMYST